MKRNAYYLVSNMLLLLTLCFMGQAWSQVDTLHYIPENYFSSSPWTQDSGILNRTCSLWYWVYGGERDEVAKACYTEDTLTVYGVAAAWWIWDDEWDMTRPISKEYLVNTYLDTSLAHTFEYYRIMKRREPLDFDILAETTVYATSTPAAYINFRPNYRVEDGDTIQRKPYRIFEAYFKDPVKVVDSFYVGVTEYMRVIDLSVEPGRQWEQNRYMHIIVARQNGLAFGTEDYIPIEDMDFAYRKSQGYDWRRSGGMFIIFPIYNPEEMPGGHGGDDPEGVDIPQGLGRYVTVSPNPASDHVRVISSFPMKRVEVYDITGNTVHSQAVSSQSADFDVTGWSTGTYLVKIITSMGETTKKLQVQ